jgi:sec-independent protein translocase protein TatA
VPLSGFDGLLIVGILVALFLGGPSKVPEMVRAIGQAKREFDKAAKEVTSLLDVNAITNPTTNSITDSINKIITSPPTSTPEISQQGTKQPSQDPIIIAAKSLGINTLGKTKQELATEITNLTTKK